MGFTLDIHIKTYPYLALINIKRKKMQYIKYLFVLVLFAVVACNSAPERPEALLDPNYVPPAAPAAPAAAANTPEPAQNSLGVWHYTCPSGHSGGSGSATACGECGTTLVHNTTYHDAPSPTVPTTTSTIVPAGSEGINVTPGAIPNAKAPEPAQNAAGVWHYTCSNGCSGGAGSALACGTCGSTLAHNTAYH